MFISGAGNVYGELWIGTSAAKGANTGALQEPRKEARCKVPVLQVGD